MTESKTSSSQQDTRSADIVTLPKAAPRSRREAVTDFARKHPVMLVAGGLAVGVLAAALIPSRARRRLASRASYFGEAVGAAGMALGRNVLSRAEAAGDQFRGRAHAFSDVAERFGNVAANRAGLIGHGAVDRMEQLGQSAAQKAQRLMPSSHRHDPGLADKIAAKAGKIKRRLRG